MAVTDAPGAAQCDRDERGCEACRVPRSTNSAARQSEDGRPTCRSKSWRHPKFTTGDADLLYSIRANLESSPLSSEGHNSAWVKLRVQGELTAVHNGSRLQVPVETIVCAIPRISKDVRKSALVIRCTLTKSISQNIESLRRQTVRMLPLAKFYCTQLGSNAWSKPKHVSNIAGMMRR